MMYQCEDCGALFDEPLMITEREHHGDGHFEYIKTVLCPECQSPYFDECEDEDE